VLIGHDGLRPWSGRRVSLGEGAAGEVVVDTTLSAILAPDGTTAGYVLACRDVSEQHALDQRLRTELQSRAAALISLRKVLEDLTRESPTPRAPAGADDLTAISSMISELVHKLQERGEQLDAIFALSPDGFVSFDADRRANYVSPAFTRLTGLPAARVLGAFEADVEAMIRSHGRPEAPWRGFEAMRRELRRAEEGTADTSGQRELIDLVRPVKRVLEVGLRAGTTAVIAQVLSLRDVTHESEVDHMKSEFLSTAAHELRTPMASIYGFVELMIHRKLSPERQADVLATVHRQTQLMISIVNELLDLSRIEARRGADFVLETVELQPLLEAVIHDFKAPNDRPPPELQAGSPPVAVCVDLNKMRQAIGNVLSNAYKYSPAGGDVEARLVFGGTAAAPMVGIEVRDHGIGMTPAQLARVCERFYRADASGNIPGTGLGMSIVKEILELQGGRLALASTPGRGTTVTLWLPAAAAAALQPARVAA
jgi:signal transduction histidine kinase